MNNSGKKIKGTTPNISGPDFIKIKKESAQGKEDLYLKTILEERTKLIENSNKSIEMFDKSVLTISASLLAVSMTFVKDIVPNPLNGTKILLILSWFLWGSCMVATLISFLTSSKAYNIALKFLFEETNKKNKFSIITISLNTFSVVFLISGIILWGLFVFQNFSL